MIQKSPYLVVLVVANAIVCHFSYIDASLSSPTSALANISSNVPTTPANAKDEPLIDKRSDSDGEEEKSIFKSLIPIVPFKKPIKRIFRSWFEPNPDALKEDSSKTTFFFTKPQKSFLRDLSPRSFLSKKLIADSARPQSTFQIAPNPFKYTNRVYNSHDNIIQTRNYAGIQSRSQPLFSLGDPGNGRGITLSLGDKGQSSQSSYAVATNQYYQNTAGDQSNANDGGGGGLSFSLGGRGGNGGSGMSISLGGRNRLNAGGGGSGMSFSLGGGGGGNGGSGISFSFGGGGGGGSQGSNYQQSSSSNYPSYSNYGNSYGNANSYGSSYGNNYGNDYYDQKPRLSVVMPSMGKTVIEANMRPPVVKMKINSSPKVKITTGTRDPLEKPPADEEIITEDIFGPPEPFDKPNKTQTDAEGNEIDSNGQNNGTKTMDFSKFPYPMYPYAYPQYYPHFYNYPYNYYYYNYYQQYPQYNYLSKYQNSLNNTNFGPTQPSFAQPSANYANWNKGTNIQQIPFQQPNQQMRQVPGQQANYHPSPPTQINYHQQNAAFQGASSNSHQSIQTSTQAFPHSYNVGMQSSKALYPADLRKNQGLQVMDHNSITYKRSSASRNYQNDMLTLDSKRVNKYSKPLGQESKAYYQYKTLPKADKQYNPNSLASHNYYQYGPNGYNPQQAGSGAGYSYYNTSQQYNGGYYNPYYYNYYNNYAKQYYNNYYSNYYNNYKKNKTSLSGFNQHSLDYHQSKIFGTKLEKYPGGSPKEDKTRVLLDIRPRVTIKMLNKTEQMNHFNELKKKKKDHMFKSQMTILMETTTNMPPANNENNNYYGYGYNYANYEDDEDEFGYTHGPTTPEPATTVKPKTTTTRRRTTTTESSSSEGSEEESGSDSSGESTSQEEDSSTTSTTTEATESESQEVEDDNDNQESTTSTTEKPSEEVIDGNDKSEEKENDNEDSENNTSTEEESTEDVNSKIVTNSNGNNATAVSPELVAAMIKALQVALGVTPPTPGSKATTPTPILSTLSSLDAEDAGHSSESSENKLDEEEQEDTEEDLDTEISTTTTTTRRPKGKRQLKFRFHKGITNVDN